ncbi:MAG: hypothetical protein HOK41_00190 [Nitrospina sp.]|jgi:predicted HicB family RNase H-like nuclease|nr:hypothetical protein [Nitrospina sp.]MBT6718568.1 hypothetical protein [Nitrospina sp.]
MSSVVQILSPQAEELQAKRRELVQLRKNLADMELQLSTEKAELNLFEIRYQKVVGAKYAEMDIVKAQVLSLASKLYPKADTFREEAESAREHAKEYSEKNEKVTNSQKEFSPPENLKKLFRRVAKKIHPDLSSSMEEREKRNELMAKLNQAYDKLDEEGIRSILVEWEAEGYLEDTLELGEQLERAVLQLAQVRGRLYNISEELEDMNLSEMFQLKNNIEMAEKEGRDLLQEIADDIEEKILKAKARIRDLAHEFI